MIGNPGGRSENEKGRNAKLLAGKFFTADELKKITTLVDLIMPADEPSPAATALGVPDFIEFMMKDQPSLQTPMRGGLMWLDFEAQELFGKVFNDLDASQVQANIDLVAWLAKAGEEYL